VTAKAIQYAEGNLGVHQVFERVEQQLGDLDSTLVELDKAQDRKRDLNENYADREVELIEEMRTVHVSYSDTRFNAEMKNWKRQDSRLMQINAEVNKVLSEIQGLEYDADLLKLRIRAGSARMEELGGYLHYLAAVKQAAQTQADNPNNPEKADT
jgi:hypothetical protein